MPHQLQIFFGNPYDVISDSIYVMFRNSLLRYFDNNLHIQELHCIDVHVFLRYFATFDPYKAHILAASAITDIVSVVVEPLFTFS